MKRKIKIFTEIIFQLLIMSLLVFSELVIYGLQQGAGQFKVLYNAVPTKEVLVSPLYPDSVKQKIKLIIEIKKYAVDSLGLNPSDNYTSYYDQGGKPVLWVITASEPYELKAKEWWFPVIGSVSYKGFFKKEIALKTQSELLAAGYDVDLGTVGAWSTLGFFSDPILSSMLKRSEGELANLIIHELTHGTIYVKSNVDFNENLASFIGEKGAVKFLIDKYGASSDKLDDYFNDDDDGNLFNEYMLRSADKLTSFYASLPMKNEKIIKQQKDSLINSIISGVDSLPITDKDFYKRISKRALVSKNAFFLNFQMYDSKQDEFEKEFTNRFNSDVKQYIKYLKQKYAI
jgi:predicted aminopeptidase